MKAALLARGLGSRSAKQTDVRLRGKAILERNSLVTSNEMHSLDEARWYSAISLSRYSALCFREPRSPQVSAIEVHARYQHRCYGLFLFEITGIGV
jgi:hypothetical protein